MISRQFAHNLLFLSDTREVWSHACLSCNNKKLCANCLEIIDDKPNNSTCPHICTHCYENDTSFLCPICVAKEDSPTAIENSNSNETVSPILQDGGLQDHSFSSSKIQSLLEDLKLLPSNTKSIVFSQWTSMLDLIQVSLTANSYKYVRLDGSMNQRTREAAISSFQNDDSITIFLISLKAGGVGLNLTAASHVFLFDIWWNPSTENQAIDRVHRLGQKKPVTVTRFIIPNTIEEKMLVLQQRKNQISHALLGKTNKLERLEELKLLFQ